MWIFYSASRNLKTIVRTHNLILYSKNIKSLKCNCQYSVTHVRLLSKASSTMDVDAPYLKTSRSEMLQIFDAGISAVFPNVLIEDQVILENDKLYVKGEPYPLGEDVYLVGFGKAVSGMAFAMEKILGNRLKRGIVSVPATSLCLITPVEGKQLEKLQELRDLQIQNLQMLKRSKVIEFKEAGKNNQPDDDSLAATESIIELVEGLRESDTLIVLISGGGSALLFQPKEPLTSEMKRELCKKLQDSGASITELNAVRKKLSTVKGGGLARIAHPAKVLTLILSDVVGDPVDFIASSPTCPITEENFQERVIEILKKYKLYKKLDEQVKEILSAEIKDEFQAMIKDDKYEFVENIIIGSNIDALIAAKEASVKFNLEGSILTNTIEGNVMDVSFALAKFTRSVCLAIDSEFSDLRGFIEDVSKQKVEILNINQEKLKEVYKIASELGNGNGIILLAGGEPTVVVSGCGLGGRNQELALRFSLDWLAEIAKKPQLAKYFVQFLSIGTDGQDGATNAAGAFGRPAIQPKMTKIYQDLREKLKTAPQTLAQDLNEKVSQVEKMLPYNVLKRNDSYCFYKKFERGENLVKTGLTGTNVMDLQFIYIKRRGCTCDLEPETIESFESDESDFLFK